MKITKTLDVTQSDDGWIVASTPTPDRDRDRVMPLGGDFRNFEKNPVLIFGHNYYEPWAVIGRVSGIAVDGGSIRMKPELREPANETDPMHIIRALWSQNLLRASSIGFIPIESRENEFGGRDFLKWELLELSLVPVPANQEAIRMAVKAIEPLSSGAAPDDSIATTDATQPPPTEPDTDDTATAIHDNDTELTPEQEAELAAALAALTHEMTSLFTGA